MGFPMFDALHTYGLGVCLATTYGCPITIDEKGACYVLTCHQGRHTSSAYNLLHQVLPLPDTQTLEEWMTSQSASLPLMIIDGLLAALFTTPGGCRVASVAGLREKQRRFEGALLEEGAPLQRGREKVASRIQRWDKWLEEQGVTDWWLTDALKDYQCDAPAVPLLAQASSKTDTNVLMTLDPAFAFSYRKPVNTGSLLMKANVSLQGTRYGALFAFIGAARFLRAQYLAGDLLNFYVPLAKRLEITEHSALPPLSSRSISPDHAFVQHWISAQVSAPETWSAMAFQALQQQGKQQAITLESGVLSCEWLTSFPLQQKIHLLSMWRKWLEKGDDTLLHFEMPYHLLDFLKHRQMSYWYQHLTDVAEYSVHRVQMAQKQNTWKQETYSLAEVRTITAMMQNSTTHPLSTILQRKTGTLTFGRALRQLGHYNPAIVRDLVDGLEVAQDENTLLRVLHRLVQECNMAAKSGPRARFLLVPTEDDFRELLNDLHCWGVHSLVNILMILSVLRYSRTETVDKYETSTLIGLLLALNRYGAVMVDAQNEEPEENTPIETFSDDPTQLFTFEGEMNDGEGTHNA